MADRNDLLAALDRLAGASVLVIGDIMLDRYVYGDVERVSPEAPVPILTVMRETEMLGGAGNVARNIAELGARALCIGVAGDDADAAKVAELLESCAPGSILARDASRPTTRKTRFIAGVQQMMRADRECTHDMSAEIERQLIASLRSAKAGAVVLSDYGKGALTPAVIAAAFAAASRHKIPVLVDPRGLGYARYRGAALVTPNRKELHEASGRPTASDAEVEAAARHIQGSCGIAAVLGTRGPEGMTLVDEAGGVHHIAAEAREVFDVSGAGDTVIATVAAGLAAGLPLLDAVKIANCAAGIVVGKAGTAVASRAEIAEALRRQEGRSPAAKITGRARALTQIEAWRRRGQRIGFTNGCFELLHPGHLHLIGQARRACDRLVVGLNSDSSVRRLKGEGRPVRDEAARAAVLSALADVDLVTIFDEDTPAALIAAIRPDVLVKGADYTLDKVVGADLVQAHGGRVLLAELLPGHSTTATVAKLRP
jgi:D-beta-D-heptose 7-phosphate kinase/D-beta-D-heptose 1-phosphate adenosyltransferase